MSINALQEYTRIARYARFNYDKGRRETWTEQVKRVMDMHKIRYKNEIVDIQDEFDFANKMLKKKHVLGSQRALQFGGKAILRKHERMYNCTASYLDRVRFFQESMYLLLCGCGVGFSVQTHHVDKLPAIKKRTDEVVDYVIPDSIEGWADAIGVLVSSYFVSDQPFPEYHGKTINFIYDDIRPEGSKISDTNGIAPGPAPLARSIGKIESIFKSILDSENDRLRPIDAYDTVMHLSDAVLAGGVRRAATICLFSSRDDDMAKAKTGSWSIDNPQRARSNNSVILIRDKTDKDNFKDLMKNVREFGEPGFIWVDDTEALFNPCCEIGMYAYDENGDSGWSFCNLCELNVKKAKNKEDFLELCRAGAILGTLQAGYHDFPYLGKVTENIVKREALIGVSMTGMMDNPEIAFDKELQRMGAEEIKRVNELMAKKININVAARTTCIKPAGCLVPDTKIKTDKGVVTIQEIFEQNGYDINDYHNKSDVWLNVNTNFKIYNEDNELEDISKLYINGMDDVYEFELEDGMTIQCTANHKFKLDDGSWKRLDELTVGDNIINH